MGEKFTTEQIINALRETNGLVSLAARRLGCSAMTIYRRAKKTQAIQQAIDDSRGELVDQAELALRASVLNKQPWAVSLVLRTLGKDRGYTERHEFAGPGGEEMVIRVVYGDDGTGKKAGDNEA